MKTAPSSMKSGNDLWLSQPGKLSRFFILPLLSLASAALISCSSPNDAPQEPPADLLKGIASFLEKHPEFGHPEAVQAIPDWVRGKRQRVEFTNGRNLLFYMKDGKVVTVYEDHPESGRKKIWDSSSSGSNGHNKDTTRRASGAIPAYTIISSIKLSDGGNHADILVPSLSQKTPKENRQEIALAIRKNEQLASIAIYSTREAYKANVSASYAKEHPNALEDGFLGMVSKGSNKLFE